MNRGIDPALALKDSGIGKQLSELELDRLMQLSQLLELPSGVEIVRQLAAAEAVFIPCSGTIMVERNALNGRRQVINFLSRGNYLGFTATENYLYSASTLEPSTLLKFPRKQFIELCDDIPTLKANIGRINNAVLAGLLDHLFAIGQKRAHERLAFFIQQLYLRNSPIPAESSLNLAMSRSDIGDYLGLTLETTSRAFSRLRNENIIATPDHHSVTVLDQDRLKALAEVE